MNKVKITGRSIGEGEPVFIIAEAGVNHNGDLNKAKSLIKAAQKAGADAVKFQTFTTDKLVSKNAPKTEYQKRITGTSESQYAMLKALELSYESYAILKEYSDSLGIAFLSTPYDEQSADLLEGIAIPAFKLSSADITNHGLLSHIASKDLPMIISTGMSTLGEVEEAVKLVENIGNSKLILLHCNFNYPARIEDVNLRAMITIKAAFQFPVGYSDHTMGIEVALAATALGASVIEKHFTLDRRLPGPDHAASLEPEELELMIRGIRKVEMALGSPRKEPKGEEMANRSISRRSVAAEVDIPAGVTITKEMLAIKRPGTGIPPKALHLVTGRKARVNIEEGEVITWDKV